MNEFSEITSPTPDGMENSLTGPAEGELVLATVQALNATGATVEFYLRGQKHRAQALATVRLAQNSIGRQAVLGFLQHRLDQPVVLGLLHSALYEMLENFEVSPAPSDATTDAAAVLPVRVDGKEVVIEAEQQLSLRCGDASITLTHEGKILIHGKYLLNRASGINRIIGGSVQVN